MREDERPGSCLIHWLLGATLFGPAGGSKKIPGGLAQTLAKVFQTSSEGWEPK
ncbi:hypothetical protein CROQUDRAFT_96726 [Cronartium quercuum f. sp. fusiforme G11]|uniref:Uncharacterized protein n=1 Tax=Cronartium quercuum f. sp. fusiforme G11 TaxID=708437 RepID=A0A9P6NAS1_9BASI|nr:hypothetical protein CROQUDRAFT_96726 [Cronartium quercuum f. sp. fusiforme G11]